MLLTETLIKSAWKMKRWEWMKFLGTEPNCAGKKVRWAFWLALVFFIVGCNPTTKSTQVIDVTDVGDLPADTLMYVSLADLSIYLHPNIQFRKKGQPKRAWTREIYYSDMDSVTIARWDDLSDKEKVDAIREAFYFNIDENEWSKYSNSENLKKLLGNTFVEWE